MPTIDNILGANYNSAAVRASDTTDKSSSTKSKSKSNPGELTLSDFYKLLAAQLQYQDADNPMDTSQMMAQMVQTQMIQAITQMSSINSEMYTMNAISYATSMVGKEVTMAEVDDEGKFTEETTTGTVTGVLLGSNPILYIGDKEYTLSQIMSIGDVPKKDETNSGGNDGNT